MAVEMSLPLCRCARCGQEYMRKSKNQKYCTSCAPIAKREHAKEYRARRKAEAGEQPRPVVPGGRKLKHEPPKPSAYVPTTHESLAGSVFDLTGKSLNRLAREAHALSLSYGEYVSRVQAGTIRAFLRNERGIADPDKVLRKLVGGGKR